jgi:hypothetical protein
MLSAPLLGHALGPQEPSKARTNGTKHTAKAKKWQKPLTGTMAKGHESGFAFNAPNDFKKSQATLVAKETLGIECAQKSMPVGPIIEKTALGVVIIEIEAQVMGFTVAAHAKMAKEKIGIIFVDAKSSKKKSIGALLLKQGINVIPGANCKGPISGYAKACKPGVGDHDYFFLAAAFLALLPVWCMAAPSRFVRINSPNLKPTIPGFTEKFCIRRPL